VRLYPIYHPAAALYTPRMLEILREDFRRIPELLALPEPPQPEPPAAAPVVAEPELAATAPPVEEPPVEEPPAQPRPAEPPQPEIHPAQLGLF
jgi:DNA polymerase